MKKIILILVVLISFSAQAQKNILLEQSFWQKKPDVDAVKIEIEKGANATQLNQRSFDAVVMAINAEAPSETIKYLLAQPGNDVNKLTHDGRIYLHWAANKGNDAIVDYLISKGSSLTLVDSHGTNPLNFAANSAQQNTKVYDLFIAKGYNLKTELSGTGANALLLAVGNDKDLKLTNYFISKGLSLNSVDADGHNAFGYAAKAGNIDIMKALLAKGVQVDKDAIVLASEGSRKGATPAAVYQYLESLKIKPTAISKDGKNALHGIVRRAGQNDIVKHFLNVGVNVNQADNEGNTVLMNAANSNRDTALFAILISKVKNINQANAKGLTALAMAVNNNSVAVVKFLVDQGATLNCLDRDGNNLAYYLIQSYGDGGSITPIGTPNKLQDFEQKLKFLMDKNFNFTAPQKNGNTLYHIAVVKDNLSLVKKLQNLSIDVNAKNKDGITALHKAAMTAKDDTMMKYLLSIGALKDAKTNFDESVLDLASENETLKKTNVSLNFLK